MLKKTLLIVALVLIALMGYSLFATSSFGAIIMVVIFAFIAFVIYNEFVTREASQEEQERYWEIVQSMTDVGISRKTAINNLNELVRKGYSLPKILEEVDKSIAATQQKSKREFFRRSPR
ncbi:MAG: hypothetical protein UX47_C0004G0060 [Candidatus Collierbacteria bacterium GW2011_GWA2_46_26]|uniref:Uncharacterized protein n=1 Tax=Candidatus Collierbacteria bacterium GW2011_GWA2_46_26 TaxID=1618381 RepID=A0A0G1SJA8_9BACT|nr:MAG: hypothetical protein UX47_C0004G0060 [Candidatus Collierbacteria bacterium GW2011_GWA2_46_26]